MGQREIVDSGVTAFDVLDQREEVDIVTQGPGDRPQPPDVLGMSPPRIMPAAVGMRDERRGQARTGRRRRKVNRNVEPSIAPVCESGTLSSSTS